MSDGQDLVCGQVVKLQRIVANNSKKKDKKFAESTWNFDNQDVQFLLEPAYELNLDNLSINEIVPTFFKHSHYVFTMSKDLLNLSLRKVCIEIHNYFENS